MILLFAPTKTFRDGSSSSEVYRFPTKTKVLVEKIKCLSLDEIQERFSVSRNVANTVKAYYQNFEEAKSVLAFSLFYGPSFQTFEKDSLSEVKIKYLNKHVLIIDALYGVIQPLDGIKPYRLDFQTKGFGLISYWKEDINSYLRNLSMMPVLSLASDEFTSLVDEEFSPIRVRFYDVVGGKAKQISAFNKQMRGKLLRFLVEKEATSITDLPNEIGGYTISQDQSTSTIIVYVRKSS